jgi:hypothetical protein
MTPLQEMKLMAEAGERARLSLTAERDALAAQRDEGLAREAELQKQVERLRVDAADVNWMVEQRDALQQHLAEAEKLARSLLDEYDEAKKNARQYRPGAVIGLALRFLASPGCADGEKAE